MNALGEARRQPAWLEGDGHPVRQEGRRFDSGSCFRDCLQVAWHLSRKEWQVPRYHSSCSGVEKRQ